MNARIMLALVALAAPAVLSAQSNEDLKKQIEQLKVQLKAVEEKANAAQELDTRLVKVETKVAGDNIQWGGDLRTRFESSTWTFKPYQQFMGFAQNPGIPGNPYPFMALTQQVPGQDYTNSVQWSTRLRLKMGITINEHAKIMGRLTMYKVHGGADVPTFNGSPNTVQNSFNDAKVPGTDVLRVERASLVYDFPMAILSIGRQNTSDGPPFEVKDGTERQATPQALAVNAQVDGIGLKFPLEKLGLPEGTLLGLCYGVGYESGFGGGGNVKANAAPVGFNFTNVDWANPTTPNAQNATLQVNSIGPLKDTTVLGAMFDMPLLFQLGESVQSANFYLGFNRFGNMTDIPFGSTNNFPVPAMPGMGGMPAIQYVTATNNLGDMDQWTATWKHKIGDTFTYFASYGHIKSNPNGKMSQYGAYWTFPANMGGTQQLAGFGGLLGDATHSQTASAYYLGMRWDPIQTFGVGLEFNHGSPRWFTYSPATGEASEKLGTRGDVWEGYIHWQFAKNAAFRLGYLDYKYSHAFSGWHISPAAMPGQSWEDAYDLGKNPMLQYGFPAAVKTMYASIEVKF